MSAERKPAGHVNTQWPQLPSERHRKLLTLLRSRSHRDAAGRFVSWWPQAKLAAELGVSLRTLQNVLADLREPTSDPRHPTAKPPGLRLGLVRVEPTTYRDASTRRHRLGGNLYVLVDPRQHATPDEPLLAAHVNTQADDVACLNKGEPTATPIQGQGVVEGDRGEHATEVDPAKVDAWPAFADSRYYSGPGRRAPAVELEYDESPVRLHVGKRDQLDHQPKDADEILDRLRAGGLGDVEVLETWKHPIYETARGRPIDLEVGSLEDLHQALDQLDRHTCSNGDRCQGSHRCKRHSPRRRSQ